jgi:hypothetical protein
MVSQQLGSSDELDFMIEMWKVYHNSDRSE